MMWDSARPEAWRNIGQVTGDSFLASFVIFVFENCRCPGLSPPDAQCRALLLGWTADNPDPSRSIQIDISGLPWKGQPFETHDNPGDNLGNLVNRAVSLCGGSVRQLIWEEVDGGNGGNPVRYQKLGRKIWFLLPSTSKSWRLESKMWNPQFSTVRCSLSFAASWSSWS